MAKAPDAKTLAELWGELRRLPPHPLWERTLETKKIRRSKETDELKSAFESYLRSRRRGVRELKLNPNFQLRTFAENRKNTLFAIEEDGARRYVVRGIRSARKLQRLEEICRLMSKCNIRTPRAVWHDRSWLTRLRLRRCVRVEELVEGEHPARENDWNSALNVLCGVLGRLRHQTSERWGNPLWFGRGAYADYFQRTLLEHKKQLDRYGLLEDRHWSALQRFFATIAPALGAIESFRLTLPSLHAKDVIIDNWGDAVVVDVDQAIYSDDGFPAANLLIRFAQGREDRIQNVLGRLARDGVETAHWPAAGRAHLALYHLRALGHVAAVLGQRDPEVRRSLTLHLTSLCERLSL